jgi:two-component sensor histidine kinase
VGQLSDQPQAAETLLFLGDGGEMGQRTRDYDWARTPLGSPQAWPQSLKTAVRLVLTSRHPMFIWWGEELIQFYNDAYGQTMGPERHPSALGDRGRDCWAEIWPIIGPQIERVMAGEGSTWHEDQLVPVTRNGALEQVWWTYGYSPIDDEGGVGGVLVVCKDVTEEHLAKEALARANEQLRSDADRLRDLFGQAPGFVAALRGPSHAFEFTNAAYERLVGRTNLVGKDVIDVLPEVEGQGFIELLDGVFTTGTPHVGSAVPIHLVRTPDAPAELHYVDFVYQPVRDAAGQVNGIFVEGYDVTERVLADQRSQLLVEDMRHRVKNTLATVQALAMLSGKWSTTVAEFQQSFARRLEAMAKTQDTLIQAPTGEVAVRDILEAELSPYMAQGGQVEVACHDMRIAPDAAVGLGLIVHELLTNAAKYGALSSPGGQLRVACEPDTAGARLVWIEETDQIIATSAPVSGFGTVLIERLARSLSGASEVEFLPTGLRALIRFSLQP